MPSFAKVFTGIVGASAVGGLSYGAIMLNKGPTLKSKLLSEGFELASNGDWAELLKAHNLNNPPKKNIFKDEDGKEKNEAWLQAKCKEVLRKNHEDNDSYKLATQWCVKKETITENDLKTKCKEMENVETISDDFNDKFELAKAWCSV